MSPFFSLRAPESTTRQLLWRKSMPWNLSCTSFQPEIDGRVTIRPVRTSTIAPMTQVEPQGITAMK